MSKAGKIISGAVVVIAIISIGYFLRNSQKQAEEQKTINIGSILPLTGKLASLGENIKNGIDLAVNEINNSNEYPFKLKVAMEDSQSEVAPAVSLAKKLIEINKVKVIIGDAKSSGVLAIAPITESNKVILFTPIASAEEITQAGDYVFRNTDTGKSHGLKISKFFLEKGINKIATFTVKSANGVTYNKFFSEDFKNQGGSIIFSTSYDENNNDFKTDISKAIASQAEGIYIAPASGKDMGVLVKQLRELGYTGIIATTPAAESNELITVAGNLADGLIFSAAAFDINDPNIKDYVEKYKSKYGVDSDPYAANGYDATMLIAKAINKCQGDKTDCIRDYLYSVKDYPGVGGSTTFDQNGDVSKPLMIKKVVDGKFVKYKN